VNATSVLRLTLGLRFGAVCLAKILGRKTEMESFKYELGAIVGMVETAESGTITGRAQFSNGENSYLVRYRAANGCQTEAWWGESAIEARA
jgi:hypothetical protein